MNEIYIFQQMIMENLCKQDKAKQITSTASGFILLFIVIPT